MAADESGTTIAGDQVGGSKYVLSGDLRQATITIIEGGVPVATIPWQQPPPATHFTGRAGELAQLLAALRPGRVVALYGPGGIGKTALAAEAIAALLPSPLAPPTGRGTEFPALFPNGVVFHTFYGRPAAVEAAAEIARAYGIDPNPDPLAAMSAALGRRAALLVLDGAEAADDLGALLDRRGGCGVLITSRRRDDAARADVRIEVERLPPDEALALLRVLAGARAGDEPAARAICELVGNLPLAVRLAGRYLFVEQQSAADYLAWLRATLLAALDFGARRRDSVPVLLARSAAQVSAAARAALGVAGCLALAPFGVAPVAAALGLGDHDARRALGELVNYELLRRPGERYEVSHALVHTYARERGAAGAAAVRRLGEYYNALAEAESARGLPGYARLGPERGHILAVLERLRAVEAWETANKLVWAVAGHMGWLDMQGYPRDRIAALEVGLAAARALGNYKDEGSHLTHLGSAYADLGQVERAIAQYEAALAIAREIGDRWGEGNALGNLGLAYADLGQVERAIAQYEAALAIARRNGDRRMEGTALGNLGLAYADLGQVERAIAQYEAALAIAREIGDRMGEEADLGNLGAAYYRLGQVERAIAQYEAALAIAREIGDRRGEGNALGSLGLAYADLGQVERAIAQFEAALAIAREIGDRRGEGIHLGNLGLAYADLGQVERAIAQFEAALAIAREIGDRRGEGSHLFNCALALERMGRQAEAVQSAAAALAAYESIDAPNEAVSARRLLARLRGEGAA